jgi:uncharacterized membrane protein YjgN (DUF898 family)
MIEYEPDYSKYTFDMLLDANEHIDREKYPERAERLHEELIRRARGSYGAKGSVDEEANKRSAESGFEGQPVELILEFTGSAREYFRIWIVNLCLTLLTLGIFSAWAKVRKKRYTYSHTTLNGTPFQYLGRPLPILKGRLIAAMGFLVYYMSTHFATSWFPYVLVAGSIVAPWVVVRSAAFNARYSAFRNMTFHFDAGYLDALKALSPWCVIPILFIGMMFNWPGRNFVLGIAWSVFAFSFPWFIRRLKKFIAENTVFGGKNGTFLATGGQFFGVYFRSGLITILLMIPAVIMVALLFKRSPNGLGYLSYLVAIPMYAAYAVGYAYLQARNGNLVWNNIHIGPLHFRSTLRCRELLKLYIVNALGIIVSLGLLVPWAVIRTMKYRIDKMRVLMEGKLIEFRGSHRSAVTAIGAEAVDLFDVDLSL